MRIKCIDYSYNLKYFKCYKMTIHCVLDYKLLLNYNTFRLLQFSPFQMVAFSTDICYVVNRIGSCPATRLLRPVSYECTRREYNISNFVNFSCDLYL